MDENNRDYTNEKITIHWRPKKCIHATTCYKELLEVFNPRKRPWVDVNGAPVEKIIEVIDKCPTAALEYTLNDKSIKVEKKPEVKSVEKPIGAKMRIMRDGPIIVSGDFVIQGPGDKNHNKMKMVSFCRCGNSFNMPFCDGRHRKIGFESE